MALPHPHGSASGQIAHNSAYDVGVTPASTGGKFVGFGEQGTSAIANRAAWALSENIDYLYSNVVAKDLSFKKMVSFTSVSQATYQIIDSVFCGDGTSVYPGASGNSDPDGMFLLFSVVDGNYNELADSLGNEVRVKVVRNSANVTDVYKTGFITNPIVTFHTVDPTTNVEVTNPYIIPVSTAVKIVYGQRGQLETIATDAFTRYAINNYSEAEAGPGPTGRIIKSLSGNRTITRAGNLSFVDISGTITMPAGMYISLNGVPFAVGGAVLTASINTNRVGVINASGVFVEKIPSAVLVTDVVVTAHSWDGSTFTKKVDARWLINAHSGSSEITVGRDATGADFTSVQDALNVVAEMSAIHTASGQAPSVWSVNIIGDVTATTTLTVPATMTGTLRIVGSGGKIRASGIFPVVANFIDCNNVKVSVRDLDVMWDGAADQNPNLGVFLNPGAYSSFRDMNILAGSFAFANGFVIDGSGTGTNVQINNVKGVNLTDHFVFFASTATHCSVSDSTVNCLSATIAIDMPGTNNYVDHNVVTGAFDAIRVGHRGTVTNNDIQGSIGTGSGITAEGDGVAGLLTISSNRIFDYLYSVVAKVKTGSTNVECHYVCTDNHMRGYGTAYYGIFGATALAAKSTHHIRGNTFNGDQLFGSGVSFTNGRVVSITGNTWTNNSQNAIRLGADTWGVINSNTIDGFDAAGDFATHAAIWLENQSLGSGNTRQATIVTNNIIDTRTLTLSQGGVHVLSMRDYVTISGNMLNAHNVFADNAIRATLATGLIIVNNQIAETQEHSIYVTKLAVSLEERGPIITNNLIACPALIGYAGVCVEGWSGYDISHNGFGINADLSLSTGVYVITGPDAADEAFHGRIHGNFFNGIRGHGPGVANRIIEVVQGAGAPLPKNVSICDNTFVKCGGGTRNNSAIYCAASGSTISRNRIVGWNNPASAVTGELIYAGANTVIATNYMELALAALTNFNALRGITALADDCMVTGNVIGFTGASTNAATCYGILVSGTTNTAVTCNNIGDYTAPAAANDPLRAAIRAIGATNLLMVGNFSSRQLIDGDSGSGGLVMANVGRGPATTWGSHATAGNV